MAFYGFLAGFFLGGFAVFMLVMLKSAGGGYCGGSAFPPPPPAVVPPDIGEEGTCEYDLIERGF